MSTAAAEGAVATGILYRKLAKVMAEVSRVPKRGRNEFHKYDYATEADLVDAVRERLAEANVFVFSSVDELVRQEITTGKGATTAITTAKMTFTFADGDSGETHSVTFYGTGEDASDKGAYKAFTGATKYFVMKSFLIPTGDDPEEEGADHRSRAGGARPRDAADRAASSTPPAASRDTRPAAAAPNAAPKAAAASTPPQPPAQAAPPPTPAHATAPSTAGAKASDNQVKALFATFNGLKIGESDRHSVLQALCGTQHINELTAEQASSLITTLNGLKRGVKSDDELHQRVEGFIADAVLGPGPTSAVAS